MVINEYITVAKEQSVSHFIRQSSSEQFRAHYDLFAAVPLIF